MLSKKILGFSLIILILAITIGAVSAEDNSTLLGDDSPITNEKTFDDIKTALDKASAQDTVELEGTYVSQGNQIKIDKDITIQGKNAILDGRNSSRIFATNRNVVFRDLTFMNGASNEGGGAVYSTSEKNTLTFINCTFINNKADTGEPGGITREMGGGAIVSLGSLEIINCTFKDNFAQYGSAIKYSGDTINIRNSQFIHNTGGDKVIYAWARTKIADSTFTNNSGFAIGSDYKAEVKNCSFINNGGGIYCEQDGDINNCIFINNDKGIESFYPGNTLTVKNSQFSKNKVAITLNSNSVMDNLTFINNTKGIESSSWSDEAFYGPDPQEITITNTLFQSNRKGAITNQYNTLKISSCEFENNTGDYGASIQNIGGTVTLKNTKLTNNTPASLVCADYYHTLSEGISYGTISIDGSKFENVNLDDSLKLLGDDSPISNEKTFDDIKTALDKASAKDTVELEGTYVSQGNQIKIDKDITIQGKNAILDGRNSSRIFATNRNVVFRDLTFMNGASNEGGGAVYSTSEKNTLTFINCTFINNKADTGEPGGITREMGGGAIVSLGSLEIINCTFKDNFAQYGSAIKYSGDTINIRNSQFIHNTGGDKVIYAWARTKIADSTFTNNSGFAIGSDYKAEVKNCSFINNGGGIYCEQDGDINNCIFINNDKGIESFYPGNTLTVKNSQFSKNKVAITLNSNSVMDNLTFINNTKGIESSSWSDEPFYGPDPQKITITNTLFKSNRKGAITNQYNTLKISSCEFNANTGDYGAAIQNIGGTVTLKNTKLTNNTPASLVCADIFHTSSESIYYGTISIDGSKFKNINLDDSLKKVELIKITAPAVNTVYCSGDKLIVNITNINTGKPVKNCEIELKVFTGKKSKTYTSTTNSNGIATFSASSLDAGAHNVEITSTYPCTSKKTTTKITVKKASTIVKAPKVTNKKYFKVSVKHKTTKKPVKKVVIKLKIGKTTYKVKTDKKGVAKFNTKNLKSGKYNVKITSGNSNYKISAKSAITIKR